MLKFRCVLIPLLLLTTAFAKTLDNVGSMRQNPGDVVFIGDSITYFWTAAGWQSWNEFYAPRGAVNTGWPGDWTFDVVDKINDQGIVDGLNSRLAVLMIGTNDLGGGYPEEEVVKNIGIIIDSIKNKLPGCKVLLLGILPRNDVEVHRRIRSVNVEIAKYDDGQTVLFLDMDAEFATGLGILKPGVFEDGVHLNANGYSIFAAAMNPTFDAILDNSPIPSSTEPGPASGVVFLGDSITYFWVESGLSTWNEFYASIGAVNTGWPGDWTTNTIDKINNQGIIDNVNAKLAVLMIGTNDLSGGSPEQTIANNIRTIIDLIKSKNPSAKVLLLGVFPRDGSEIHQRVRNVNNLISGYGNNQDVFFLDMETAFANGLGQVKPELYSDGLHLTSQGYVVWAENMNPTFDSLLGGGEVPTTSVGPSTTTVAPSSTLTPPPGSRVVFLGDSITYFWIETGLATWNQFYGSLGAVNTGWPGDWTTSTIDKITNQGIIDNLNANLAVLMIGTNDLSADTPAQTVADNIQIIIDLIKQKNPGSKILLLSILPRGDSFDGINHQRVRNVNAIIQNYGSQADVYYLDMEDAFSYELGMVYPELYTTDWLHLSDQGYVKWAETMNPLFNQLLNANPKQA